MASNPPFQPSQSESGSEHPSEGYRAQAYGSPQPQPVYPPLPFQQPQPIPPQPQYQPYPQQQQSGPPFQQQQQMAPQSQYPSGQYQPMGPQQQYQPYPQWQAPTQPPQMMTNVVQVNIQHKGPGLLVRALYFIFIGWWAGYFWLNLGFFCCFTVVLLPLGLVMLNRLPQVLTLRSPSQQTNVNVTTVATAGTMTNVVQVTVGGTQQVNFLLRAVYFVFVGSWVGYLWATVGYLFCCTFVLLPVGLMMLNRLPAVLTLRKN